MNRAPAPVPSIEETSLNRLWAAPKLPRLSFNQLAVSGCTVAVPPDQLGRWRAGRQLRHTRRGSSMMVAIRQTPSAGRRFRVARRPRVLGGSLLAERHHERAVGVVVGARPLLNHPRECPNAPLLHPRRSIACGQGRRKGRKLALHAGFQRSATRSLETTRPASQPRKNVSRLELRKLV